MWTRALLCPQLRREYQDAEKHHRQQVYATHNFMVEENKAGAQVARLEAQVLASPERTSRKTPFRERGGGGACVPLTRACAPPYHSIPIGGWGPDPVLVPRCLISGLPHSAPAAGAELLNNTLVGVQALGSLGTQKLGAARHSCAILEWDVPALIPICPQPKPCRMISMSMRFASSRNPRTGVRLHSPVHTNLLDCLHTHAPMTLPVLWGAGGSVPRLQRPSLRGSVCSSDAPCRELAIDCRFNRQELEGAEGVQSTGVEGDPTVAEERGTVRQDLKGRGFGIQRHVPFPTVYEWSDAWARRR